MSFSEKIKYLAVTLILICGHRPHVCREKWYYNICSEDLIEDVMIESSHALKFFLKGQKSAWMKNHTSIINLWLWLIAQKSLLHPTSTCQSSWISSGVMILCRAVCWKPRIFQQHYPKSYRFFFKDCKTPFSLRTEICSQMVYTAVLSISVFPWIVWREQKV